MYNTRHLKSLKFQLSTVPYSEGLVLELLDNEEVIIDISVDEDDEKWFRVMCSEGNIAMPLDVIKEAISKADARVYRIE